MSHIIIHINSELDPTTYPIDSYEEIVAAEAALRDAGLAFEDVWVGEPGSPDAYKNGQKLFAAGLPLNAQIRALRDEASAAADIVMVHACGVALGEQSLVVDACQFEERYGGGGLSPRERDQIMAIGSRTDAMVVITKAVNGARAVDPKS